MFTADILSKKYTFLFSQAKEIELQTHCRVRLIMAPNWANGKTHSYKSMIDAPVKVQDNNDNHPPPTYAGDAAATNVPPSPKRMHPTVRVNPLQPIQKLTNAQEKAPCKKTNKEICRVCGQSSEISFWLGCSYRNPKTKRQDCKCWVHQNCIGIYYKTEKDLERVPYYYKKHAPTYKKK